MRTIYFKIYVSPGIIEIGEMTFRLEKAMEAMRAAESIIRKENPGKCFLLSAKPIEVK